jgi:HK97 family phage prohead protease
MKINFPVTLTAADNRKRTISGTIVTWGERGNTSAGATVFEKGSIDFSKPVKLLLEHDRTRPIGKLMDITADDAGIEATFKIAGTIAGDDSLLEAAEGLRDGFSVGVMVDDWENKDGVMSISAAKLIEVSLVTDPAIDSARVADVAATETPAENSEATAEDKTTQEDKVSDTASEAPIATEAVEATKTEPVAIQANQPVAYTQPRSPINSKATYLEHSVRAALGNDESKMYVAAAASTSNNAGLVPTRQLTEVVNGISNADRPIIDSISRGALPDAGMTFEIPKITAAPTVAVASEGGTPSNTDLQSGFISVNVQKFIGQQVFSLEILDRSSPAFFNELVRQMEFAYAKATDVAVGTALINGGTDGGNRAAFTTGALVSDFVSDAAVSIYKGTLGFAQNIIVSPEQWGALMGLVDSSNRPIFQQTINPQNAGGTLTATAIRGNLLGLNLRVSTALTDGSGLGDNTAIIVNPDSYTWYESARLQLQTNVISTGQIQVAYYGYGAVATKLGAGAYRFMVA